MNRNSLSCFGAVVLFAFTVATACEGASGGAAAPDAGPAPAVDATAASDAVAAETVVPPQPDVPPVRDVAAIDVPGVPHPDAGPRDVLVEPDEAAPVPDTAPADAENDTLPAADTCGVDGGCQPDPPGPRVVHCDTQNAYLGYPLGIHCFGEGPDGEWLEEYELVAEDLPDTFLEGNAVLTDRELGTDDLGMHHFEIIARDAAGVASPVFPIDVPVDRLEIAARFLHGVGVSPRNFPNPLYDLLGTTCRFAAYTPLADLAIPASDTVTVEVLADTEPAAVTCMTELLAALPADQPEVWRYARHYGGEPLTEALFDMTGYRFRIQDHMQR